MAWNDPPSFNYQQISSTGKKFKHRYVLSDSTKIGQAQQMNHFQHPQVANNQQFQHQPAPYQTQHLFDQFDQNNQFISPLAQQQQQQHQQQPTSQPWHQELPPTLPAFSNRHADPMNNAPGLINSMNSTYTNDMIHNNQTSMFPMQQQQQQQPLPPPPMMQPPK